MSEFNISDLADPVLPWKGSPYFGTRLSELATDYLIWMLEKAEKEALFPIWLNDAVKREWRRRSNAR